MASSSGSAPPSGGNLTPNQAKPAKRSSSKLDILLMKLHNTADNSGASPDPVVSRSGSSRRKPKVTRKVTESEENEDNDNEDEYMDNGSAEMNGKSADSPDPGTMNGNTDGEENVMDSVTVDEEGNHVLPDGTMVVQPEPVLKGQFRGPEFSKSRNRIPKDLDKVMCTGCNKQLNPHIRNAVRRHPVLKVLICKKCYDWYTSDDIDQDSDGMDEQCRWCGEGGNLLCCDYCHNAFCKACIKRNLGRAELSTVDDADDDAKWRCYVCNCKPLKKLVEHCNEVLQIIEEEHNKRGGQDCDSRSDKGKTKGKGKNGAQKSGSSTSVSRGKGPATPNAPGFQQPNTDFEIGADKTKPVLNRLTAVTTSFQMFLSSLESDYKNHAKKKEIEVEVSKKLKRAMLSYKKLFAEIETFARGGNIQSKASPQAKRINSQQGEAKQQHARAASPSVKSTSSSSKDAKVKTDRISLPKKTTEVIELSSEDDSEEEQKPSTKKVADVKASSEMTCSSSETVTKKGENGESNVDEPNVEAEQSCKTEELIMQTESELNIGIISNVVSEANEELFENSITKDESEETQMEVDSEEKTDPDAIKEDSLKQNDEHAEEKDVSTEADMEVTSGEPAKDTEDNIENNPDKSLEQDPETQKEVIGDDLPSADKDVEDYNQGDFISVYRAALDAEVNKDSQVDEDEAIEERVAEVEDDLDSEDDAPLVDRKKNKSAKRTKTLSKKGENSKANDSDSDDEDDDKTSSARRKSTSQAGGSKKGPPRRTSNKRKGEGSSDSSSEDSDHKDSDKHRKSPKAKAKKAASASDKEDKTSRLKLKEKKREVVNLDSDSEDERPLKKETTNKKKEHSVSDSENEEPKKEQHIAKSKDVDEKPEEKAKVKKGETDSDNEPEEKIRKSSRQKAKEEVIMSISDSEEDAPTQKGKGTGKGKSSRKDEDSEGKKSPKGKGKGKSSAKKSLDFLDAEEKASTTKSSGRSREDIEAQRKLHQEMLVGDSSDSDDKKKSDSESDPLEDSSHSSSSVEEQGSDYDPLADKKDAKKDRKMSRTESAKKKTQDKFKALREKREKEKKKQREKVKKERETRRKKRKDDSSDESDDDEPAKSKSKKKSEIAKSKAKKKTFFDDLDDSDTTKGKKDKKSKKAKDADSDSSDDDKKPTKKKKSKKEKESDSSVDSELDKDIAKLTASVNATTHKKTKKDGEVDKEAKKPAKKKKGKKSKDNDSDSSDDGKKPVKKKEGKKAKDTDSDSSDDDKKPARKKKKQGSDVESEDDAPKMKSSKGNEHNPEKDSSDDFDSDSKTDKKAAVNKERKSSKEGKDKDDETDGKSKVKKEKKPKAEKVEEEESDSSADSELDKDIAKLAALPLKIATQKKSKKDGEVDKETKKKKKEAGPDKSPRLARKEKAEKKGIDIDELSGSDSASDGKDEPDEAMEITLNSDEEEEQLMKLKAVAENEEADKKARRALLASDSDSDLSANSSDDEDDDEGGKKKKKKDKDDGTSDSSDLKTKSGKKRKTTALLNTKLSDSDGSEDDEKKTKKSNGKKKGSDDEFELDDEDEDEDLEANEEEDEDDDDDKAISIPSDSDESVGKKKKKKKKGKKDDSDEEIDSEDGKKKKSYEKGKGKRKRKRIKAMSDSSPETEDSDAPKPKSKKRKKKKGSDDEEEAEGSDEDGATPGKKRKNIKKLIKDKKLSQDTKEAAKAEEERRKRITERQKQYNIVQEETETAGQKIMVTTKLVLESKKYEDEDGEEREKTLIQVHPEIINKLKPHQVEAVKFLWGCLVESLERLKTEDGAGCILAHCMGLGKTLSMISFIHTLLANMKRTKQSTCIVVCPLNTVLNWEHEFEKWVPEDSPLDVYELTTVKDNWGRADMLKQWHDGGGILIMGYEMYRNLSQAKRVRNKKQKKIFTETLVDPGPDLVVCDEGHILKNDKSSTSIAMNGVRTKRRVVLTGTPLQNNLGEYHCMVSFVKPSLLGTRKEFSNRFVNPITNGQCANASKWDVKLMKKRAHILHETLNGCVQRKDYAALTKFLPPKHEYILSIRLSKVQCDLYQKYLDNVGRSGLLEKGDVRGASLFSDYQNLSRIWTHPWILKLHEVREQNKRIYDDEDSFVDDDSDEMDSFIDDSDDNSDDSDAKWGKKKKKDKKRGGSEEKEEKEAEPKAGTSSGKRGSDHDSEFEVVKKYKTRSRRDRDAGEPESEPEPEKEAPLSREWWSEYVSEGDQYKLELSGKLFILAEILKMSEAIGDKVLVFSQSLLSLDLIEDFLEHWDKTVPADNPEEQIAGQQSWSHGIDYFRMDGSTNSALRKKWSEIFNDAENPRARLFLISTKAGSLGTNMVGANRCIIFDASWNPTHDVQSIFRVYRFGQVKPVYIYRFLAQGTMEEKIYERQVTKQSLSSRVVDEHQIERHFTSESLQELYNFTPERLDDPNHTERPTPVLPKDRMLAEMITSLKTHIVGYHEHDSLLENQIDEELSEEDRKAAWEEYEAEKKGLIQRVAQPNYQQPRMQMNPYGYPMNQQQPQQMSMFPHLTEVARAIRNANPNVSMQELQQRLEHYMRLQMASQQQVLYQQQQQHMQRYGVQPQQMMPGAGAGAGAGAPEPGEVTFMGYGNGKGGAQAQDTGSALYSMLNGSKQPE